MTSIRALARDSIQYMVGLGLMGLANIVLVPLYAHSLSPEDFGAYALIEIAALGLMAVCGLGYGSSYIKWYADIERSATPALLAATLWVTALVSSVVGIGFWAAVASPLAEAQLEAPTASFAWVLAPLLVLECLTSVLQTHFRAERKPIAFSLSSLFRLLAITAFSVMFMVHYELGLPGVFFGRVAGDAVGLAFMFVWARHQLQLKAAWHTVRPMLRFGLPLIVSSLVMMVVDASGRYFLGHYSSLYEVGCYSVGIKISGILRMAVVIPFGVAWGGLLFQIAARPNAQHVYSKLTSYVALLAAAAAVVFSVATPLLFRIFATPAYASALTAIPILLLIQAVSVLQYPAAVGLFIKSGTGWLVPIHLIALAGNVVLNLVLVPSFGMMGAAWAWMGTWVILIGLMATISRRIYPIPYEWIPLGLAASLGALSLLLSGSATATGLMLRALVGGIAVAAALVYVVRDIAATKAQAT